MGDLILVVDIGGGTTDFTLIAVTERDGELSLDRVAVGEHILLGGDNIDLALAGVVSQRLAEKGTRIDSRQLQALWANCRVAKERLLEPGFESQRTAGHDSRQRLRPGGRNHQGQRCCAKISNAYSAMASCRCREHAICPRAAPRRLAGAGSALRRRCRHHPPHGALSAPTGCTHRTRRSAPRAERLGVPHAHPVQRRRVERGPGARAHSCGARFVAGETKACRRCSRSAAKT